MKNIRHPKLVRGTRSYNEIIKIVREVEHIEKKDWKLKFRDKFAENMWLGGHMITNEEMAVGKLKDMEAFIEEVLEEQINDIKDTNFKYMKPCEPDCDEVRHANHEGSWDHYYKMDRYLDSLTEKENK